MRDTNVTDNKTKQTKQCARHERNKQSNLAMKICARRTNVTNNHTENRENSERGTNVTNS